MSRYRFRPSPNHGPRRDDPTDLLILHYTGMQDASEAVDWLCNPASEVSCHYFVHEDGQIEQLVAEDRRAWHAGRSAWQGITDVNSRSIGVEIHNLGHEHGYPDFPNAQMDAVIALSRDLCARLAIPPERVLAHSDIAPARKRDPGEKFNWAGLHASGVGHWVEPAPITGGRFVQLGDEGAPVEALQAMLVRYGYDCPVDGCFDEATAQVVTAFQRHFRPARVDGVADRSTIETLHKLSLALPNAATPAV